MNLSEILAKYNYRFPGSRTIETDEGWAWLIDNFLLELEHLDPKREVTLFCIKEKFGLMRIDYNGFEETIPKDLDSKVFKLADRYEELSKSVCEKCGEKGAKLRNTGWMKVLCKNCVS